MISEARSILSFVQEGSAPSHAALVGELTKLCLVVHASISAWLIKLSFLSSAEVHL